MHFQENPKHDKDQVIIETCSNRWIIPSSCGLLKLLIKQQGIYAEDLQFNSQQDCQYFIKHLFLLALKDEVNTGHPSTLAQFARELIAHQP